MSFSVHPTLELCQKNSEMTPPRQMLLLKAQGLTRKRNTAGVIQKTAGWIEENEQRDNPLAPF